MSVGEWYEHTSYPANSSLGSASAMRSELERIETGISGKLPNLSGNGGRTVKVNAGATALEAVDDSVGAQIATASAKTTPVDADTIGIADSAASNVTKKVTWANVKATLWTSLGALVNGGTDKATPVGADLLAVSDSEAASATKKLTLTNLAAFLAALAQTLTNKTLTNPTVTNYVETLYAPAAGSAFTVDLANGTVQKFTTNANATVTLPASVAGKSYQITVAYGGTHTLTWAGGSTIKWAGGQAPTATSSSGKFDKFAFDCDGTNTYGRSAGSNY